MTIIKRGWQRRDPLGGHQCWVCKCEFVVQHADPLPLPDRLGDIDIKCPNCGRPMTLNGLVPPAET